MIDMARKSNFLELIEQNQDIIHKICGLYAINMDEKTKTDNYSGIIHYFHNNIYMGYYQGA